MKILSRVPIGGGEDELLGITDRECRLCFAIALVLKPKE
jgi:hypothetical protein